MKQDNMVADINLLKRTREIAITEISHDIEEIEALLEDSSFKKIIKRKAIIDYLKNESFFKRCKLIAKIIFNLCGCHKNLELDCYLYELKLQKWVKKIQTDLSILMLEDEKESKVSSSSRNKKEYGIEILKRISRDEAFLYLQNGYIVFLVNNLDVGGLEQVVAYLARNFFQRKIKVEVWCLFSTGEIANELLEEGIIVRVFQGNVKKIIQYAKSNPPILINSHYTQMNFSALSKLNIPIIEVIHNMYIVQGVKFLNDEREKFKYCDKVIAVSQIVKQVYLSKMNLQEDKNKVIVIENAAEIKNEEIVSRDKMRQKMGISEDSFVFLNVGSIDRRKNQLSIIEAFDIVSRLVDNKVFLILIGNIIDNTYYSELEDRIKKCHNSQNVLLLQYSKNIQSIYQAADAFVMNSYYEGWSIAATEALYYGLPIIHSECGSARELTKDGRYGIMISNPLSGIENLSPEEILHCMACNIYNNLDELVKSMMLILTNQNQWKKNREAICNETRKGFSKEKMFENYAKIFGEIIKKRLEFSTDSNN